MQHFTPEQVQQFRADGFLAVPYFLSADEYDAIAASVDEIASWPNDDPRCVHYRERTEQGSTLARTEEFLQGHEPLAQFLTRGKLVAAISELFGEPAVVFKEKLNYKNPGGGGFAPHQDAAAYDRFGSLHITCLVAIDPNTVENGCLWFAPGNGEQVLTRNEHGCLPDEVADELSWQAAPLPPRGVLFFHSLAPHKSAPNHSSQSRRSLYVTYGKQSEGALRDAYYSDRKQSMAANAAQGKTSRISTIGHFQGTTIE